MTREQKLEAALRNILHDAQEGCDYCQYHTFASFQEAREALATPPTSEWNEAITEVIALIASGKDDDQVLLRQRIRALKRKG